ncbi:hypothetical protein FOZ60_014799 [Perkinsus olseni]|uniref:Immunoglobulin super DCC subclass member n=1 Tax=Perkinsus olseni TaxID=32597 RepID=A0A7J6P6K7_PEROL|nr:hypothetical protein FOZ60_014799 [Perkinsus olseni]
MQTVVGILGFMGLRSLAVDWEAPEPPRKYWKIDPQSDAVPGIERSLYPGQGGVYQRPIGKCGADLSDCTCTPPASPELYFDTDTGKVTGVLCTMGCSDEMSCPNPPRPLDFVKCQPFGKCFLYCSHDEDCPGPDGICVRINLRVGTACMYKP